LDKDEGAKVQKRLQQIMSKVRTVFGRSLSVGSNTGEPRSYSYDNPAFLRGFHGSKGKSGLPVLKMSDPAAEIEDPDGGPDETDIDDESFRSGKILFDSFSMNFQIS
jgi:hypothetical protein